MKTPVIGVTPLWDEEKKSIWMLPEYLDGIREAGAIPMILPLVSEEAELKIICGLCDGFMFTGGHDVSPTLYDSEAKPYCGETSPMRDVMEAKLFSVAYAVGKPILGICRGLQFINVMLGGSLYQDLAEEFKGSLTHSQGKPYDGYCHQVSVVEGTPLALVAQADDVGVNSLHHQGIRDLAPPLTAMAHAPDGLIEAVYEEGRKYLMAVQWHPEFSLKSDALSAKIFASFVEACR